VARKRDFNPIAPERFNLGAVKMSYEPNRGMRGGGREFVILLPRRLVVHESRYEICTGKDEMLLRKMLARHFGGFTADPDFLLGTGLRESELETNEHRKFTVVASRSSDALCYFQALCKELEDCSGEEQVFITYQDIAIL
jgi:hypothetical protein